MTQRLIAVLFFVCVAGIAAAQITDPKNTNTEQKVNQTDSKGQKQGLWRKNYPNGKIAYEAYFKNDKPVGEYKRYHINGKVSVHIRYDNDGKYGPARIYNEEGELEAEGFFKGQEKDSLWTYYMNGTLPISEEHYSNGKKNGRMLTFFRDGSTAESRQFVDGVENGIWKMYYPTGKQMSEMKVVNNELNGYYYKFTTGGTMQIKGAYKDGQKDGKWTYYFTPRFEIEYENGVPINKAEVDSLKSLKLKYELEHKDNLADPDQYRGNPEEYMEQMRRR